MKNMTYGKNLLGCETANPCYYFFIEEINAMKNMPNSLLFISLIHNLI